VHPLSRFLLVALALTALHLLGLQLSFAVVANASPLNLGLDLLLTYCWLAVPAGLCQAAVLSLPAPGLSQTTSQAGLFARAVTGALALTIAVALPVVALADLPEWLEIKLSPEAGRAVLWWLPSGIALTWIVLSLLLTYRSKGAPDLVERRVAQAMAGTLVGLALATPWYLVLRRKQQCFCSLGTFWALLVGLWSLVLVGGPLLLLLARERRTRAALR
jgi:hypothetical protein